MAEAAVELPKATRREFLYYIWFASMTVVTGASTGLILWFALPRFREGEFGGKIPFKLTELPEADTGPAEFASVKIWLVQTSQGVLGIFKVCTHLGCLYKWVPTNDRFECPCHGSKFQLDGTYIEGPAPRNLDRFSVALVDEDGNELATTDEAGNPVPIPSNAAEIIVDTGNKILGELHG